MVDGDNTIYYERRPGLCSAEEKRGLFIRLSLRSSDGNRPQLLGEGFSEFTKDKQDPYLYLGNITGYTHLECSEYKTELMDSWLWSCPSPSFDDAWNYDDCKRNDYIYL